MMAFLFSTAFFDEGRSDDLEAAEIPSPVGFF